MKLTQLFGADTRPDHISWLMTEEGRKHVEEKFAPADPVPAARDAHMKFGRCVWLSMQVLSRKPTDEFLNTIFDAPYPKPSLEVKELQTYLAAQANPIKWKVVEVEDVLKTSGLWS